MQKSQIGHHNAAKKTHQRSQGVICLKNSSVKSNSRPTNARAWHANGLQMNLAIMGP